MKQNYEEIVNSINKKSIEKAYLIDGLEPFFIDQLIEKFSNNVLEKSEIEYSLIKLNGKDLDHTDFIAHAYSRNFFSSMQIILIRDIQNTQDLNNPKFLATLKNFLISEKSQNHIIFVAKNYEFSEKSGFFKLILEYGVCFRSKKLYENQIIKWIEFYVTQKGTKINSEASSTIFKYIGNNITKIAQELDKIIDFIPPNSEITHQIVEKIASKTREYSVYELQTAIAKRSIAQALEIAHRLFSGANQGDIIICIATLYSFFSKTAAIYDKSKLTDKELSSIIQVPEFFVDSYLNAYKKYGIHGCTKAIEALYYADLQSKGIVSHSMTPLEIIHQLIVDIAS